MPRRSGVPAGDGKRVSIERLFDPILDTLPVQRDYAQDAMVPTRIRCRIAPAAHAGVRVTMLLQHSRWGEETVTADWHLPAEVWQQVFVPLFNQAHCDGKLSITYAYE